MKKIMIILIITISTILVSGCLEYSADEQKAMNITQNYGTGNYTILLATKTYFLLEEERNNTEEMVGWSANRITGNDYNVTVKYRENGVLEEIEFKTNIATGSVTGVNPVAKLIVDTVNSLKSNSSQ